MPISTETRKKWNDKLYTIIESKKNCVIEFSNYEIDFIDNISKLLQSNVEITFRQSKFLNKMYQRCFK